MARTAITVNIASPGTYTVPVGKQFIGSAQCNSAGGGVFGTITLNGVNLALFAATPSGSSEAIGDMVVGPIVADPGDVFSGSGYALNGFLYDI